MWRQKAGCNPGKANAGGQRAWWQLPRGIWRVLSVLSVWSLANGRLECPNNRGLCAGKGQAAMLEQQRLTARGLGGSCREGFGKFSRFLAFEAWANGRLECPNNRGLCAGKRTGCNAGTANADGQRAWWQLECPDSRGLSMCRQRAGCNPGTAKADGQRAWWQLPRGIWKVFRVLSVCSLANGRLECLNNRGLCAGKGQAAMLEQQRLTARGLGGSCRQGFGKFSGF